MAKVVRSFFGSLVNVKKWSSYDDIVDNAKFVAKSFKDLYKPKKEVGIKDASFDELVKRLQLSEEDIKQRSKYFLYYFLVYFFSAVCLFGYLSYLIMVNGRLLSILVTLILAVLMLVYALREHFWYMQLKKRKVGCTFKDWFAFIFKIKGAA